MTNKNIVRGIVIHIIVMSAAILIGVLDYRNSYQFISAIFGSDSDGYQYELYSNIKLMLFIFFRNSATAALMLASGPMLSMVSIASIAFNGYIIGGVVQYRIVEFKDPFAKVLGLLAPHGIPELSALLYVSGMSFDLAITYLKEKDRLSDKTKEYVKRYFVHILPLLLLAAFIEAFITPIVGSMV